jgi:hypothetical protein
LNIWVTVSWQSTSGADRSRADVVVVEVLGDGDRRHADVQNGQWSVWHILDVSRTIFAGSMMLP